MILSKNLVKLERLRLSKNVEMSYISRQMEYIFMHKCTKFFFRFVIIQVPTNNI